MSDLEQQIEREKRELAAAPTIPRVHMVGRCHLCGRVSSDLVPLEVIDGFQRFAGKECCRP